MDSVGEMQQTEGESTGGTEGPVFGGVYLGPKTNVIEGATPPVSRPSSIKSRDRSGPSRSSSRRHRNEEKDAPVWGGVYVGPASSIPFAPDPSTPPESPATHTKGLIRRLSRSKSPKTSFTTPKGKVKCEVCKKKCSGDILRADEKYFHIACFACKMCHRPLSEVGFFVHKGQYYCPNDYHANFGKNCPVCSQLVEGEVVEYMGKTFHQRCFKCHRCKQNFPNGEKVTFTGQEYLCGKCLSVPVAVKGVETEGEEERPISPPGVSSPTACAACSQLIHSGQVLLALEKQWHIWCFKCQTCDAVLHGEYMSHEGRPYCIRDYNAHFGVKCYECDEFIAGRVLQAGGYQFHPTCARCTRCNEPFGDGEEMYMQGDEIWHPRCNDLKPQNEKMLHSPHSPRSPGKHGRKSPSMEPKYTIGFGQHLTYMYLLPEPNSGYLKQPINPHPPNVPQFHTPQAESLEDEHPRPKSPHMDNEEPIEMSHYPGGHAPMPEDVPAIEREDFPAPPYPYAIEDIKRRYSTSDVEEEDEDYGIGVGGGGLLGSDGEDAADGGRERVREGERLKRGEEELRKLEKDSSLIHAMVVNLEEEAKKTKLPLHWDPRSASRTPSAKKLPQFKCRYESPINASPSRYLNRPKPWYFWKEDRSATSTLPYSEAPKPGYGLAPKSSTLPVSNGYFEHDLSYGELDTTRTADFPQKSMGGRGMVGGTMPTHPEQFQPSYPTGAVRTSLPDMSKPPKIYTYDELVTENKKLPEELDRCHLERHLAKEDFDKVFHMTPLEFYKLPDWKRINLKRKAKLF